MACACGGRARSTDLSAAGPVAANGSSATGGTPGASTTQTIGDESAAGAAGATGAPEPQPLPPAQIAGSWGMFQFEDSVGVRIVQTGALLSGTGCAGGVPPQGLAPEMYSTCGSLSGAVKGQSASFAFGFVSDGPDTYGFDVMVSPDARRMTGRFHNKAGIGSYPMAWLRVKDGQSFLELPSNPEQDPRSGWYSMQLADASPGATAYVAGKTYDIGFSRGAIASDLGSFWSSEMSDPSAGSPLRIGPVSSTDPSLPTSLDIDFDDQGFTQVRAEMASGEHYLFDAKRRP